MERAPADRPEEAAFKVDHFPLFSALALAAAVAAYFAWAIPFFHGRVEKIKLSENRYIRMEWRLLQELKLQSDRQLLEKDIEIAELREKYARAVAGKDSQEALKDLEERLRRAEAARMDLLAASGTLRPGPAAAPSASIPLESGAASLPSASMSVLLLARIDEQEGELLQLRSRSADLERDLAALKAGASTTPALKAEEGSAKYAKGLAAALENLRALKAESEHSGGVGIDDLNAWALLRALANTPSIKEKYPELLPAVEKYVAAYGSRRQGEGRGEAYAESIRVLEALSRGLK